MKLWKMETVESLLHDGSDLLKSGWDLRNKVDNLETC